MENTLFIGDFPIQTSIFWRFSMAMFDDQRVCHFTLGIPWVRHDIHTPWFCGKYPRATIGYPNHANEYTHGDDPWLWGTSHGASRDHLPPGTPKKNIPRPCHCQPLPFPFISLPFPFISLPFPLPSARTEMKQKFEWFILVSISGWLAVVFQSVMLICD